MSQLNAFTHFGFHSERKPFLRSQSSSAPRAISPSSICLILLLLDVAVLIGTSAAAFFIWLRNDPYSTLTEYSLATAFGTLLTINLFTLARVYDPKLLHHPRANFVRTAGCWCAAIAILMSVSFLTKLTEDYSRLWAALWFVMALTALLFVHWCVLARTARWIVEGKLHRRVAVVGMGSLACQLSTYLKSNPESGVRVVGLFSNNPWDSRPWHTPAGFGGDIDTLISLIRLSAVDTVFVADEDATPDELDTVFERLREVPADIRYCPNAMALKLIQCAASHYGGVAMLNVADQPLAEWRYLAKEIEDRLLATAIVSVIAPLLLLIAVAIRLDSKGPIFFRQKRFGYNNQLVEVWKFRTMYHDQEDQKAELLTQENDSRVTRIGEFLRRWSLDELPQFINVLRGEMSIVGPRPHAISAKAAGMLYQEAVPHYAARHRVKPGITGWAQINGWRGTTHSVHQIAKRVEYDMQYIENWSLWLDLKIIALTLVRGFSTRNAR